MVNNLKMMISELPEAINSSTGTPVTDKLFQVHSDDDPNMLILDKPKAPAFYHAVAKALFVTTHN